MSLSWSLRGFAPLAVTWFHFAVASGALPNGWLRSSGVYGWLGVEVFFVISGFIIPYSLYHSSYRAPEDIGRFVLKRMIRLDPPYLIAIVMTIALGFLSAVAPGFRGSAPHFEWIPLLLHLGYLNAFFAFPWVIPVFWTLAIEFQFYLLMAVTFPILARRSTAARFLMVLVFCGASFLLPGEAWVFRYLGLFALGLLTFQRAVGLLSQRDFLFCLPAVAAVAASALGWPIALAGLLTALAIAFLRVPTYAPLVWLGSISYSLYLLHVPIGGRVVNLGFRWAHDTATQMTVLALAVAVSLFAAHLLYRFVERPAKRWSSSIGYGRNTLDRSVQPNLSDSNPS